MSTTITNVNDNQMLKFAVVMVASVATAVTASTLIIMSLLGGPSANAMTTQNNNTQSGVSASMCVDPSLATAANPSDVASAGASDASVSPLMVAKTASVYVRPLLAGGVSGSFNTTNSNTTTTTTTFNTTTTTIRDNGNSYSASWNNGNTAVFAPTTNTSQNNGNTNNQNNGNSSANTSTVNTTTNTTTTTNTSQNNGNTNNQNNGNTTENNPTTTTTTNTSQNNGNQDNDNNGNTYSAEASIF